MLFYGNPAYDNWWINKISNAENENLITKQYFICL